MNHHQAPKTREVCPISFIRRGKCLYSLSKQYSMDLSLILHRSSVDLAYSSSLELLSTMLCVFCTIVDWIWGVMNLIETGNSPITRMEIECNTVQGVLHSTVVTSPIQKEIFGLRIVSNSFEWNSYWGGFVNFQRQYLFDLFNFSHHRLVDICSFSQCSLTLASALFEPNISHASQCWIWLVLLSVKTKWPTGWLTVGFP